MPNFILNFILNHWVRPQTLQEFVKNLSAPCYIAYTDVGKGREPGCGSFVVLVKGFAINFERRLAGHSEIVHKSMFNCGI